MICAFCGCTDESACCEGVRDGQPIPCHWVAPDLCSLCRTKGMIEYALSTGRPWLYDGEPVAA